MITKTLYKKDSKGTIRFLELTAHRDTFSYTSGVLGTDSPVKHEKICTGKNIGKKNETTPAEQAISELESKFLLKQDEGYFTSIHEAETTIVILPMLAKDFNKEKKKIDWDNCYAQAKLDGMRCLAFCKSDGSVKLISRKGKQITTLKHLENVLSNVKKDVIIDSELYIHGETFQYNMKAIKKYRKGITEKVKLRVYDLVDNSSYMSRWEIASEIVKKLNSKVVEILGWYKISSEKQLKELHKFFLSENYEGTMIRWGNEPYKVKGRSSNLLKFKEFKDIKLKILDVIPSPTKPKWGIPIFEWKGAENNILKCGTRLSHKEREEILINKHNYIGKMAELRFFEYSEEGVPRFPIYCGLRLD